jgi:hypothetical protein
MHSPRHHLLRTLRGIAALVVAILALLATPAEARKFGDEQLYQHVAHRVASGQGYYDAVAIEHRAHGFSVRPVIAVRPPVLAYLDAWLPLEILALAALALCIAAWASIPGLTLPERVAVSALLLAGGWLAFMGWYAHVHEFWAGLLLAISIAIYRPERWWPSLILATLAVLIRELALPFILLAGTFAVFLRRWTEAAAWAGVVALFAAYMAFHAWRVTLIPADTDPVTSGWLTPDLAKTRWIIQYSLLRIFPEASQVVLAAAGLFGWLGLNSRYGAFAFLYLAGMTLLIIVGSRADNLYWTFMLLPVWFGGFAFWPRLITRVARHATMRISTQAP